MMKKTITINILGPIIIALSLWLCITGRVPWWIMLIIWAKDFAINVEFNV